MKFDFSDHPHRRYNPLTGECVLVLPNRAKQPWQCKQETCHHDDLPSFDPKCYLCPSNVRSSGARNPKYSSTYVFTNDFASLILDATDLKNSSNHLIQTKNLQGTCRVICFSPSHDLTLAEMPIEEIQNVIDVWADQICELGKRHRWVQIF